MLCVLENVNNVCLGNFISRPGLTSNKKLFALINPVLQIAFRKDSRVAVRADHLPSPRTES
jgi:hypothetical protein